MRTNKKSVQFKAPHWADIRRRLAARGGRLTPQRMAIYDAVVGRTTHPSVTAVYEEVRQRFPALSRATVYSTLEFFARLGLVQEVSGPVRRYDGRPELHINLVCSRCGQVSDVADAELEPLRRRAVGGMGFHVEAVRFELHGVCSRCRARRQAGRAGGTRGRTDGKH